MKIIAFAGGVGGAKLVNGLARVLPADDFSVIVNTGDDFVYSGLYISPDIDTVTYTLAGINDQIHGWGIRNETWEVLSTLKRIGHPAWFNLGDKDLATHIERTRLLSEGFSLTEATKSVASKLGVTYNIFPMTDSIVRTIITTVELGKLSFQEYFVKHKFQPRVKEINFEGIESARLPQVALSALDAAELVVFCPSNPYVSIKPILSIPGVLDALKKKTVIAISPIINGKTIKGPAAKMMVELGVNASTCELAKFYRGIIDGLIIGPQDASESVEIRRCGIIPYVDDILMPDVLSQISLARKTLEYGKKLLEDKT